MSSFASKLQILRNLDFFGSRVELLIRGGTTFKTYLGALLTVCAFVGIGIYAYLVVLKVFSRSDPSVNCTKEFDMAKFSYEFQHSDLVPLLMLYNKRSGRTLGPEDTQRFVTLQAFYRLSYYDYQERRSVYLDSQFAVKVCTELQNTQPYRWFFSNQQYDNMRAVAHCIELPPDFVVQISGNRMTQQITSLKLVAYPCSLPGSQCAAAGAAPEIEDHSLVAINSKKFLVYKDFESPVKSIEVLREEMNLMSGSGTSIFYYLGSKELKDETNWFQPIHRDKHFVEVASEEVNTFMRKPQPTCSEAQIASEDCSPHLVIEFRSGGLAEVCTRKYTEVLNAFSDIGGFKELVYMAAAILYSLYNEHYMRKYARSRLLDRQDLACALRGAFKAPVRRPPRRLLLSELKPASADWPASFDSLKQQPLADSLDVESQALRAGPRTATAKPKSQQARRQASRVVPSPPEEGAFEERQEQQASSPPNAQEVREGIRALERVASKVFEEHTRVTTLVRELATLGVLKELLFSQDQIALLPLVAVEAERKKLVAAPPSKARTRGPAEATRLAARRPGEATAVQQALVALFERQQGEAEAPQEKDWREGWHASVDAYLRANLPQVADKRL